MAEEYAATAEGVNPMKRPVLLIACWLLGSVALPGEDFWTRSKFPEWSRKDTDRMLTGSPWAQAVQMAPSGGGGAIPSGGGGGGRRGRGGGGGLAGEGGGGVGGDLSSTPPVIVTVRWHSALPIKQAVAMVRYQNEAGTSPEAARMLARKETYYIVGIIGLPPHLAAAKPDQLKQGATLHVKGKEDLRAADLMGETDQKGRTNLYFFFPRDRGGAPGIALEDKDVEVVLKAGRMDLKKKFRLKDMVYQGQLEI